MWCRYVMNFNFLVMEKSWKINVEKEGATCTCMLHCCVPDCFFCVLPSVLGYYWLGDRKGIRPVKIWVLVLVGDSCQNGDILVPANPGPPGKTGREGGRDIEVTLK